MHENVVANHTADFLLNSYVQPIYATTSQVKSEFELPFRFDVVEINLITAVSSYQRSVKFWPGNCNCTQWTYFFFFFYNECLLHSSNFCHLIKFLSVNRILLFVGIFWRTYGAINCPDIFWWDALFSISCSIFYSIRCKQAIGSNICLSLVTFMHMYTISTETI